MKRALVVLIIVAVIGGSGFAFYKYRQAAPEPTVTFAAVTRGDIVDTVGATGTLQAVTTVQVGTQVSGTIMELNADFNSLVRKGQVLARLDPSLFQTQIEQANANLVRAQADLERLRVTLEDARTKVNRARELAGRKLIPQSELDAAEVAVKSAEAQIRSSQASVTQAEASLNQNKVNLQHTVIAAPIDGLVISRNVDVGQTVAASMNAPTLFVLAADLTKMQVVANLDESDVGRIRPRQHVTFRVDAYPAEDFSGSVAQVRLQPIVQQNVVTYATVIDVSNPQLKLKPGMTANVTIEIARRDGVLRVPNTALRFRPTSEMYAALGQTPPAAGAGRGAPPGGRGRSGNGAAIDGPAGAVPPAAGGAPSNAPPAAPDAAPAERGRRAGGTGPADRPGRGRGGDGREAAARGEASESSGRGGIGGGRGRFGGRMADLSSEEREQLIARMRAGRGGSGEAAAQTEGAAPVAPRAPRPASAPAATTIDALFGPLPQVESRGRVWLFVDKALRPLPVRLGISDGQATELIEGDLQEGTELVTNVSTGAETRPTPGGPAGFPPFMGGRGDFGRGGGNNRGGNRGGGR